MKDEEKRNRSLGIMSVDNALNFLQKRGDSPHKQFNYNTHQINSVMNSKIPTIDVDIF